MNKKRGLIALRWLIRKKIVEIRKLKFHVENLCTPLIWRKLSEIRYDIMVYSKKDFLKIKIYHGMAR